MLTEYTIVNVGANKRLNVYGDNVTSLYNNHNLTVWEKSGTDEQKFIIENFGNGVYIRSVINPEFGLNVYRSGSPWNCDLYPIIGNETDAAVNIVPVGGYYRIQLANYPSYYLTAGGSANGSNVYWSTLVEGSAYQTWGFYEVLTPTPRTLNVPSQPNKNYKAYGTTINNYGDRACCGCNIDGYYNPGVAHSILALGGAPYYAYDINTAEPNWSNFPNAGFTSFVPTSIMQAYRKIRLEILEGRPVILKVQTSKGSAWVVAHGFTGNGNSTANINTFDPNGSNNTSDSGDISFLYDVHQKLGEHLPITITEMKLSYNKNL